MIGQQIQNYQIVSQIGEGGMGVVYQATHTKIDRKVAIKILNPNLAANPEVKQRFLYEAKTLSNLTHQNIVTLFDFIEDGNNLCLVMEYVEGIPLDLYITKQQGPIPEQRALRIFEQILNGFQYAHNKGIVHRDIKPSNIILQADDTPKILDFGIAKIINEDLALTRTGMRIGSVYYMSPEQILGENIDQRSDIYSLGITLFEMLTAKKPYDAPTSSEFIIQEKIVKEPLPSARTFYSVISDGAEELIRKSTEKNPGDRFQTCSSFRESVLKISGGVSTSQTSTQYAYQSDKTMMSVPPPPPQINTGGVQTSAYYAQSQSPQFTQQPQTSTPPVPPVMPPQTSPYANYGIATTPKKGKGGLVAGIIIGIVVLFAAIGVIGYVAYNSVKDKENDVIELPQNEKKTSKDNKTTDKDNKVTDRTERDNNSDNTGTDTEEYTNARFPGAKLYFCEKYDDINNKEIGVSKRFTTGYLTVMVDLRKSGETIGTRNVIVKITKIKDASGNRIPEKLIKNVKFTVQPSFDYIFFTDEKNIKFSSAGTYKVSLMDSYDDPIVSNEVEIVERD